MGHARSPHVPSHPDGDFAWAPRLRVVAAGLRPGRLVPSVARWFEDFARARGGFDPVLVVLAEFDPPVYDESKHPLTGRYRRERTERWSVAVADVYAYAFAVPEYNDVPPLPW